MALLLLFALYVLICKLLMCQCIYMCLHVSACVYMCPHVSTCVLVSALMVTYSPMHVLVEFHTCVECRHTVWFLTTVCCQFCFLCFSLFADTIFCTLCSVLIVCDIMICYCICYCFWYPFSFNDLLIY